ncbi:MAG: endonuclease/exonuclease/phosphatase family protein [Desulfomicrobium apsheronum]|nr:endonuclease/exonuclease/phosphatase family protein [Desulfomicrobium apsheronum]
MKKFDSLLAFCVWCYLAGALAALALMNLAGDVWWPATMLLYGPRWMLLLPAIPLLPLAMWRRPRLLVPLVLGLGIVLGPFMGFRWSFGTPDQTPGNVLRVLSCNIGGPDFNSTKLSQIVRKLDVDIVCLQECPRDLKLDLPPGWHELKPGGISIFSKYPIQQQEIITGMHLPDTWPKNSMLPCIVESPFGNIAFNGIHLPTARFGILNMLDRRMGINPFKTDVLNSEKQNRWLVSLRARKAVNAQQLPTIIAGDFNMPVESMLYQVSWDDLKNAFDSAGRGYNWTTSQNLHGFPMHVRLDHILTRNGVTPMVTEVAESIGSDHLPIIADVLIPDRLAVKEAIARNWKVVYDEKFMNNAEISDGQSFGSDGWLTASIRNGGSITGKDGEALFETKQFQSSALIRISESLPPEYNLSVVVGKIRYGIDRYEESDFHTKGFKYNKNYLENGFYWIVLTDRLAAQNSGEDWWHRYRKIVIDSDDHINEKKPVYMVYMNPDLDRNVGDWTGGQSTLLRCWSNEEWVTREDNWEVAFRYDENSWYTVEIEKINNHVTFRAFAENGTLITESAPVHVDDIYGMGKQASKEEFAYVGEPHIDSYKGDARVKRITLSVPKK